VAETLGSLVDKLSIMELKRFHMGEQIQRRDVSQDHREECRAKLAVLNAQRDDLAREIDTWLGEIVCGTRRVKVYRQFKMYNDPKYLVQGKQR